MFLFSGAGDEARTRYLHLGKVALYRMSYTRISNAPLLYQIRSICQEVFSEFFTFCHSQLIAAVIFFVFCVALDPMQVHIVLGKQR